GESSGIRPRGVYAMTKAAGELAVQSLCDDFVVARTSVPYGPFPHVKKDFVRWLRDELAAKRPVRIVSDQISNPTWILDLARMIVELVARAFRGVVHTGGATQTSRLDFARLIARVFALDASLIQPIVTADLKQAAPRPLDASLSLELADKLGLNPMSLEQG